MLLSSGMKRNTKTTVDHDALVNAAEDAWETASQVLEAAKRTGNAAAIDAARVVFHAKRLAHSAAIEARMAANPKLAREFASCRARYEAIQAR